MKTDDELIAEVLGIEQPKFACGCPRPFGNGFGYRDPLAICRECRDRKERRQAIVALVVIVVLFIATVMFSGRWFR